MAENRRRFRHKKRDDGRQGAGGGAGGCGGGPNTPVTIARRHDEFRGTVLQPKILLKKEPNELQTPSGSSNNDLLTSIKTIIINRSDARVPGSAALPSVSTNHNSTNVSATAAAAAAPTSGGAAAGAAPADLLVPLRMTRPSSLLVSHGVYNSNARKLFHKTNTDFTVIGVLGAQSMGKSTLLNLLAMERASDYDYFQHLFAPAADECIFGNTNSSKPQQQQTANSKRSARGESLQFFVSRERHVLLDAAASVDKDPQLQELQTMSIMMQLLSVCHVLLLVLDELSLEQLRLLHAALRLRPRAPLKGYLEGYLPQLIFVRTRAQRQHFEPQWRATFDKQLELLYQDTGLCMHRGSGDARMLNSFLMPQVRSNAATAHHASLFELVRQFRERVFTTIRHPMFSLPGTDFTEHLWFELLTETNRKCNTSQQYEKILIEIKQRHVDSRAKWRNDSTNWRNES